MWLAPWKLSDGELFDVGDAHLFFSTRETLSPTLLWLSPSFSLISPSLSSSPPPRVDWLIKTQIGSRQGNGFEAIVCVCGFKSMGFGLSIWDHPRQRHFKLIMQQSGPMTVHHYGKPAFRIYNSWCLTHWTKMVNMVNITHSSILALSMWAY